MRLLEDRNKRQFKTPRGAPSYFDPFSSHDGKKIYNESNS